MTTSLPAEDLHGFLERQPKDALVAVLLELAQQHDAVQARLARMRSAGQPGKLAAGFRKTLAAWKRPGKFYGYREAGEFGRALEGWLGQVERELLPNDPSAALALFQEFIEADAAWFERADDSDGAIGDAVRSACLHWLRAAARCDMPGHAWPDRLLALYLADQYGARGELLRCANALLDEQGQRELAARLDAQLAADLAACATPEHPPIEIFRISGALSLLAESLHDPDVTVRATLRYSPNPNPVQRQSFARSYIEADRPADALVWLQEGWGHMEESRLGLLAQALEKLARFDESVPIRQGMFERTLSGFYLDRWLAHLPEAARPEARAHAHGLALAHPDLAAAATVLLDLGDADAAEARLLSDPGRIDGSQYGSLVPLADALRSHDCRRGEAVIYRALLRGILDRGYARAYGHAAQYWSRLSEIAGSGACMLPLPSHEEFVSDIRARHGRKKAFWAHVSGIRRDRDDDANEV